MAKVQPKIKVEALKVSKDMRRIIKQYKKNKGIK